MADCSHGNLRNISQEDKHGWRRERFTLHLFEDMQILWTWCGKSDEVADTTVSTVEFASEIEQLDLNNIGAVGIIASYNITFEGIVLSTPLNDVVWFGLEEIL